MVSCPSSSRLRDRDLKFGGAFNEVFRSESVKVIRLACRAPRVNSVPENLCGTARREMLDHLFFGRHHLERRCTSLSSPYT